MKNLTLISVLSLGLIAFSTLVYLIIKFNDRRKLEKHIRVNPLIISRMKIANQVLIFIRYLIYGVIGILLGLSLLNPSFSQKQEQKEYSNSGVDILFLVDVSLSMNANDVYPERLSRFKEAVLRISPNLEGNRLGIIAFAGTPFLYCPLTKDISAFNDYIKGMDIDMIANTGTDIREAFNKTEKILTSKKVHRSRIVILVTDGEDLKNRNVNKLSAELIIWGVGTKNGGNIHYKNTETETKGYVTKTGNLTGDPNHPELIQTKLNEEYLLELSKEMNAAYINISQSMEGIDYLLNKIKFMSKNEGEHVKNLNRKDGYQYLLSIALLLFILDISIIDYLLKKELSK